MSNGPARTTARERPGDDVVREMPWTQALVDDLAGRGPTGFAATITCELDRPPGVQDEDLRRGLRNVWPIANATVENGRYWAIVFEATGTTALNVEGYDPVRIVWSHAPNRAASGCSSSPMDAVSAVVAITVVDPTGAVVAGATVTGCGDAVVTDEEGHANVQPVGGWCGVVPSARIGDAVVVGELVPLTFEPGYAVDRTVPFTPGLVLLGADDAELIVSVAVTDNGLAIVHPGTSPQDLPTPQVHLDRRRALHEIVLAARQLVQPRDDSDG